MLESWVQISPWIVVVVLLLFIVLSSLFGFIISSFVPLYFQFNNKYEKFPIFASLYVALFYSFVIGFMFGCGFLLTTDLSQQLLPTRPFIIMVSVALILLFIFRTEQVHLTNVLFGLTAFCLFSWILIPYAICGERILRSADTDLMYCIGSSYNSFVSGMGWSASVMLIIIFGLLIFLVRSFADITKSPSSKQSSSSKESVSQAIPATQPSSNESVSQATASTASS